MIRDLINIIYLIIVRYTTNLYKRNYSIWSYNISINMVKLLNKININLNKLWVKKNSYKRIKENKWEGNKIKM